MVLFRGIMDVIMDKDLRERRHNMVHEEALSARRASACATGAR